MGSRRQERRSGVSHRPAEYLYRVTTRTLYDPERRSAKTA
jgi:hypothetical protein